MDFEKLYHTYYMEVYSYVMTLAKQASVAEEVTQEVFQLRIFGELSFAKIGIIFGKTENWARVTYHRARLKIQEGME